MEKEMENTRMVSGFRVLLHITVDRGYIGYNIRVMLGLD